MNAPSLRYEHVYAVVRADTFQPDDVPQEERITVKKIVLSQENAEREVARLNALNIDKGVIYFWQMTRMERSAADTGSGEPAEQMAQNVIA